MKLPFFNQKKLSKNYYLGLFLKEEEGIALVLRGENGKMTIEEKQRFIYSNGWENLIGDVDELLFKIEKNLNIELEKTIFFIYSHLLNERGTELKKTYLIKIKDLVKNLELSPLGYIECYEAVSLYLTEKEEMPLTAILVELDFTQLSIFVYKGGRLSYRKILSRSQSLVDDLTAGFEELKGKFLLPARIILYNTKDLDAESTKILTHRWSEEYFIQLPKVEILKEDEVIEGLVKIFEKQSLVSGQPLAGEREEEKKERLGFIIGGDVEEMATYPSPSAASLRKTSIMEKILILIRKFQLPKVETNFSAKLMLIVGAILILSSLMINELFFHKATLTVFVPTVKVEKSITIPLPYKIATVSAEFSQSKSTSGKREVGEKARGEVLIYNTNLNKEKFFNKGMIIETSGLKFILDEDIKVATATNATTPGVGRVKVTAEAIGSEYNLSKGKRFNIDETSYAETSAVFTGGSKRKIQTISQTDIEELEKSIIEKAKNNNKNPLREVTDAIIVPQLTTVKLKEAVTSGEVGEEASTVTLKAKVDSIYYYYQKNHLLEKLVDILTPQIPSGFILDKKAIAYNINSVSKEDKEILLTLLTQAKAVRKISQNDILKNIIGKHKNSIKDVLQTRFQIQGYNLSIRQPLPILKNFLPFFSNNITLIISSL